MYAYVYVCVMQWLVVHAAQIYVNRVRVRVSVICVEVLYIQYVAVICR